MCLDDEAAGPPWVLMPGERSVSSLLVFFLSNPPAPLVSNPPAPLARRPDRPRRGDPMRAVE